MRLFGYRYNNDLHGLLCNDSPAYLLQWNIFYGVQWRKFMLEHFFYTQH